MNPLGRHSLLAPAVALVLLVGCPLPEREPLPDWSDGVDPIDTGFPDDTGDTEDTDPLDTEDTDPLDTDDTADTDERDPDAMALYTVDDNGILSRLNATGTEDPCELVVDGTLEGYESLDCLLDTPEMDLWGWGLSFDFQTPEGLCDFVVYAHYQYEAWEVGVGPSEVSYTLSPEGKIDNEVNSINGTPYCPYDYSFYDDDAPNCCTGSYLLSVYREVQEGDTDEPEPVVTGPTQWGGNPADCYSGAAYIDPEASFNEAGWPIGKIVFVDQARFEKRFQWNELSADFASAVPLANYYDPAFHDGGMPRGLAAPAARPYYVFQCYDHAEELLAQVRLQVREWNTLAEYLIGGDPHVVGTEPVSGEPLDDRADWRVATPGSDLLINGGVDTGTGEPYYRWLE